MENLGDLGRVPKHQEGCLRVLRISSGSRSNSSSVSTYKVVTGSAGATGGATGTAGTTGGGTGPPKEEALVEVVLRFLALAASS
eukprot:3247226-Amphidinium_carterae.1